MGIRFYCPNGHKLNVKSFQAGRRGICPFCGAKIIIPAQSTRKSGKSENVAQGGAEQEIVLQPAPPDHPVMPAQGATSPDAAAAIQPAFPGTPQPGALQAALPVGIPITPSDPAAGNLASSTPLHTAYRAPAATMGQVGVRPVEPLPTQSAPQTASPISAATDSPPTSPPATPAGPPDPLAEAGNVVWYVRPPSGGQFGPATSDVMRTWIGEGRVSADSLVWREGWRDWLVAGEVFPQLGGSKNEFGVNLLGDSKTGTAVGGRAHPPRSRRQETLRQVSIITLLVLAVGLLVGVFAWVVFYYPT